MAQDATGTPTSLGIPKYNTAADAPSGKGFNAAMDSIDALIVAKGLPTPVTNGPVYWNGSAWVSAALADAQIASNAAIAASKIAGLSYVKLAETVLGSSAANIDIQSIPGGYNNLQIHVSVRGDEAVSQNYCRMRLNNDSGASAYQSGRHRAVGNAAVSQVIDSAASSLNIGDNPESTATANIFSDITVTLFDYANTSKDTTFTAQQGGMFGTGIGSTSFGVWFSTAAVTRVTVLPTTGPNFVTGSRMTIYGVL